MVITYVNEDVNFQLLCHCAYNTETHIVVNRRHYFTSFSQYIHFTGQCKLYSFCSLLVASFVMYTVTAARFFPYESLDHGHISIFIDF